MAGSDGRQPERLPIKVILPKQGTEKRVPGGGNPPKPFRTVDSEYRKHLSTQVRAIGETLAPSSNQQFQAAPVRVKLISKAAAKSHRPEELFCAATCPIVGAGRLGELFIKATPGGLERLARRIEDDTAKKIVKQISSIEVIESVTADLRRKGRNALEVLRKSPKRRDAFVTRVRLFNFADADQDALVRDFEKACAARSISIRPDGYSRQSFTYSADCKTVSDVEVISRVVGVRSVSSMPIVRTLRTKMVNQQQLPRVLIRSEVSGEVPVVVVVDSGVSEENAELANWVVGRESNVAPEYRNTAHGTFVAGLICWGSDLNPNIAGIDQSPCGIFDLQVIPNADPASGETESLTEPEFLQALEGALKAHANEYKVWNLSLGTDEMCSLEDFSEFAVELDNLQERYQVSFVISAGNYSSAPLLSFPRKDAELEVGRITTPGDSVLGITVGAISHVNYRQAGPKEHELSAFSRHGAGPNYIIKPDLVHYGGACTIDASHVTGVRSVSGAGSAENIGTSFAAPLVSRTLAQIYHQITPTPSPVLARALLTHHARHPLSGGRVPDGDENYFGFGLPGVAATCLQCSPFSSTLVFEDVLRPGHFLEWDDFPYPPSLLRDGRYYGEIWMTVAFAPARGVRWGSEYCETHIDAHFGVYFDQTSRETGEITPKFKGLVPPEHKNPSQLFESYQIEKLRKWAPVRTYHGNLSENGERGKRWRLKVQLLTRHGIENEESYKPQPFSLIVTIADPEKKVAVYDEMARRLGSRFQSQNLAVRAAARVRVS